MKEYDIRDYMHVIWRRAWIIILATVVMAIISGIVSVYFLEPVYQTHATLLIVRPLGYEGRLEYTDILLSQKLAATYGEIARSRYVSNELIRRLELDMTSDEVRNRISVTLIKDTEIIMISVKDKSPETAALIANEASKVFMEHVSKIMNIENIQFVDMAEVPQDPVKPKPLLYILFAAASGIVGGILVVLLIEYFDNTIKSPEDVKKYLDLPVVGMIPKIS